MDCFNFCHYEAVQSIMKQSIMQNLALKDSIAKVNSCLIIDYFIPLRSIRNDTAENFKDSRLFQTIDLKLFLRYNPLPKRYPQ